MCFKVLECIIVTFFDMLAGLFLLGLCVTVAFLQLFAVVGAFVSLEKEGEPMSLTLVFLVPVVASLVLFGVSSFSAGRCPVEAIVVVRRARQYMIASGVVVLAFSLPAGNTSGFTAGVSTCAGGFLLWQSDAFLERMYTRTPTGATKCQTPSVAGLVAAAVAVAAVLAVVDL